MTASPRRSAIWGRIPTLSNRGATKALVLLAVEELAQNGRSDGPSVDAEHPLDPYEVASVTGLSLAQASNALRDLADDDLVARTWVLAFPDDEGKGKGKGKGAPRARVKYLPAVPFPGEPNKEAP